MHPEIRKYANSPVVAIDTETTGLNWWSRDFHIGGYSLYSPSVGSVYIPVRHETLMDTNEDAQEIADSLSELGPRLWLMHNRGYDENVLATADCVLQGDIIDTIGLWWVINPHEASYALKKLGAKYIDPDAAKMQLQIEKYMRGGKLKRYTQIPASVMAPYARKDAELTYALWELGQRHLPDSQKEIHDTEQIWIANLSRMARAGLPIDSELAQQIVDEYLYEAHKLRVWLAKECNMAGFNPNSGAQVVRAAHGMGVELPSTGEKALQRSNLPVPFRDGVISYRKYVHTVSSYHVPMIHIARDAVDGRVHSSFRTTTKTGRVASSDPINLQGLPRADEARKEHRVREIVRSRPGYTLGFNDYRQIDVRIGTHYAQDEPLLEILRDPSGDIHSLVHQEMLEFGLDPSVFTRGEAKRVVFGTQYGVGPETLSQNVSGLNDKGEYVEIGVDETTVWLKIHRQRFPGIPRVMAKVESVLRSRGYIFLYDGRIIRNSDNEDPHKAYPWLVSGSVAQAMKRSINAAQIWIDENGFDAEMLLQVHDEVVFEAVDDQIEEVAQGIAHYMGTVWPECRVPLYVQPTIGDPSWADKKSIGEPVPRDREAWEAWRGGS